jgi:hypothetical protein
MNNTFRATPAAEPLDRSQPAGRATDALSQIRALTADEERPSREDRGYGETIFSRPPVELPRFLTGKRGSRRRRVDS